MNEDAPELAAATAKPLDPATATEIAKDICGKAIDHKDVSNWPVQHAKDLLAALKPGGGLKIVAG